MTRSLGSSGEVDNAKDGASAASVAKTTCFGEKHQEMHTTVAGPLRITCDPNTGWSQQPASSDLRADERASYAPFKMTLNGELVLEDLFITAELVKKKEGFEYWLIHRGLLTGNGCESFKLLAVGKTGHHLHEDLHKCTGWTVREPDLTFAGLSVRDDALAIDPMCEPYLKAVPAQIKVRHTEFMGKFVKYSDPDITDAWLKKVPVRFRNSNYMPFGCQINDYDGVIVVYGETGEGKGYGLYLSQKQAFPERN